MWPLWGGLELTCRGDELGDDIAKVRLIPCFGKRFEFGDQPGRLSRIEDGVVVLVDTGQQGIAGRVGGGQAAHGAHLRLVQFGDYLTGVLGNPHTDSHGGSMTYGLPCPCWPRIQSQDQPALMPPIEREATRPRRRMDLVARRSVVADAVRVKAPNPYCRRQPVPVRYSRSIVPQARHRRLPRWQGPATNDLNRFRCRTRVPMHGGTRRGHQLSRSTSAEMHGPGALVISAWGSSPRPHARVQALAVLRLVAF
jgi:hypothetical protein